MITDILIFGSGAALIHFLLVGLLYMNPLVSRMYLAAEKTNPAIRIWPDKKHYMLLMFFGSLIETWILSLGYLILRDAFIRPSAWETAVICAVILAMIRVYPRAFDKWIQTRYPLRLIAVEAVNGFLGSVFIILGMRLLLSLKGA